MNIHLCVSMKGPQQHCWPRLRFSNILTCEQPEFWTKFACRFPNTGRTVSLVSSACFQWCEDQKARGKREGTTVTSFCVVTATPLKHSEAINWIGCLKNQTCSTSGDYHSFISKCLPCNLLNFSCMGAGHNNPGSLLIVGRTSFYIWPTIHHCPSYKRNKNSAKIYKKQSLLSVKIKGYLSKNM